MEEEEDLEINEIIIGLIDLIIIRIIKELDNKDNMDLDLEQEEALDQEEDIGIKISIKRNGYKMDIIY